MALLITLLFLVVPISAVTITFSDNNLIQGYSIDLYSIGNGTTGSYNITSWASWNSSVVTPISLDPNGSYIGVIRQNQVARFNNFNELGADALDWITANYIGLFFLAIIILAVARR